MCDEFKQRPISYFTDRMWYCIECQVEVDKNIKTSVIAHEKDPVIIDADFICIKESVDECENVSELLYLLSKQKED